MARFMYKIEDECYAGDRQMLKQNNTQTPADDGETVLRFDKVCKSYDGQTLAVRDFCLDIRRGEFLTLLGPSGSGKSTVLMMLAGFESPTEGLIVLNGKRLNEVPAHERELGLVFQNYALFPHMNVFDNVAYPLRVRRTQRSIIKERVNNTLAMVRLAEYGDRLPSQLSGGQQQRVALARALVYNPQIVLLDEPLGALDRKLREEMQIEIRHIHESLGVTFVFVTHDQDEALTMSDRIAVFREGTLQQVADPTTLYEHPANHFVATFVGETNMLSGTISKRTGKLLTVKLQDGTLVRVQSENDFPKDVQVQVSVRPERLRFFGESDRNTNQLVGEVIETIYHGTHAKIVLNLLDQTEIKCTMSADKIPADLAPGTKHKLFFQGSDARIFID